jgi:Bacterial Ig domain/Secretion system C-terminal sorting domain
MKNFTFFFVSFLCYQQINAQCTPAALRATAPLNTPGYALNTAFNIGNGNGVINNLSNGVVNFTGSVSGGTADWVGGVQIQNEASVGNHIFVQPNNTDNVTTTNDAVYTFDFSEKLYDISFRIGGMNNLDQARVTAFNGVTSIPITAANFSNIVNDPGNGGTIVVTGNVAVGNNTAGNISVITNTITVSLAGPVTRIVIEMGKSNDGNGNVTIGFTSFAYTRCVSVPPDVNATFVNTAVTGNVGTNDIKPAGTTYGTATAQPGYTNPSASTPTINSDGTYSFTPTAVGVYKFLVPMCIPGVVSPDCPLVPLVITVTGPLVNTNNPVANIDRATTPINTNVTLNTLANDKAGNNSPVALNPASVTVTTAPLHGTTSVDPTTGNITYMPTMGYTGFDTLTYQVCDLSTPTPKCATSLQIITIEPAASTNTTTASDDYNSTPLNTNVSGNVKTNDNDPQGNTQTVTAQNTTISGKGTLVLGTNGAYTFSPEPGFTGPVNFPYQTCDNGSPVVCTNATLYILVFPSASVLPINIISFNAKVTNANTNITWVSSYQVNVNRFEIERSGDNQNLFTTVGTVAVNNGLSGSYSFTDVNAKNFITKGYYRLKIIDNDGRFSYSKIVLVNFGKDFTIEIKPTLIASGQPITILTSNTTTDKKYVGTLYNQAGQVLQTWNALVGSFKQIETSQLSRGVYLVKIISETEVRTEKIVIQ